MQYVPDIAAKRAELTPQRIAFVDESTGIETSYGQLNDNAARCASALAAAGIEAGDRVAILCLNCVAFFEILMACGKLGAVLVPLNWRQPVPELLPILEDSGAKLLFHDAEHAAQARELVAARGITSIALADYPGWVSGYPPARTEMRWPTDRVWYLLYTSGTTGMPKAVIQTPGMAYANYVNIAGPTDMTGLDSTANFLPLFHTAGINLYTLPMLICGGRNHLLAKFDVDVIMRLIASGKLSIFFGVPAIYQAISLHKDFAATDFSRLRSLGCGGAPLPETLIRLFGGKGVTVCNGFGMTETGPTVFLMDRQEAPRRIGSVGKPQMLTEVKLVDDDGHDINDDRAGEILMRGPNITPGYYGNESATRAAFTKDGWLKSGDVGRRDADGYYYIVDRIKDMYISGGENVYPAEVEAVIYRFPGVQECAVLGIADEKWGEVGCAYVMPLPDASLDAEKLRQHCRANLAAYKVPKRIEIVQDFPRTAAGKIRKHVLRDSNNASGKP
ncbi:AMP-binding protein [Ferrovibrio sp.]|uniref:AMP-binding protein n=1 Tax=Ferrovibrio sp. TaxID=1917215 RepID=UPI0035AE7C9B